MKKFILMLITALFLTLPNMVFASEYGVDSGDSVKGMLKIGTKQIGSNYYYEVASGNWDSSALSGSFQIDWHDINESNYNSGSYTNGTTYKKFVVEFCVNGGQPDFAIWSSYYNKIDYMYYTGNHIYLSDGDWSYASCYRAFISLYLNFTFSNANSDINWYTYTAHSNTFGIKGNDGFNKLIRYTDLIYYSDSDYAELLEKTKTTQTQIEQNNTIINQNTQINNSINDVNSSLNNDSVDTADSKASEWASKSLSDNAVANMVTMPITLLQAYLNGLNGTCSSFSLGTLYDHELTLPCINLSSYFGSTLWGVIDILFSGFMIYALGKKFVKIFNDFTNLRDNQVDELYGGGN